MATLDTSAFTEEQKGLFNQAAALAPEETRLDPISSNTLSNTESLTVPPTAPPTDNRGFVDSSLQSLLEQFNQTAPEETTGNTLQDMILGSVETLGGQGARQAELEQEAGLGGQRTELQGVINQLQGLSKEAQAIPLQIQQESEGRGRTAGGVAPIQAGRLRENAIKSLGLAAIGQTLQGNISLAESSIAKALEVEFEPERTKLETLKQMYNFNKDALERVDKKRADNMRIILGERERLLNIVEADKKEVYNLGKLAAQYDAPSNIIQDALKSGSPEEALAILSPHLQDPVAQQQLANAKLNNQLTKLNIKQKTQEMALFNLYGGMTKAQYDKSLQEEQDAIDEATEGTEQATLQAEALGKKLTLLNSIYNPDTGKTASGLETVVGPTIFSRGGQRQEAGFFLTAIKGAGTALSLGTGGALFDEATGGADNVVNMTEQFISQEFLQSLIDVKAKGATFGALQRAEQIALTEAATKIGGARITKDGKEDGKVIGYDMSEADYKAEIALIQFYANLAHERAVGKSFLPDEQEKFNIYEQYQNDINAISFNPEAYF